MRRVVVTGMGGITPLGNSWEEIHAALRRKSNAVKYMEDWEDITSLNTKLGVPVMDFEVPSHWPRKFLRSMGRVAQLSVRATELALEDAGLLGNAQIKDGSMGIAYGSSFGSVEPIRAFARMLDSGDMQGITSTSYIQIMSHTAAVNIGVFFGLTGVIIPTSSACTSGSQAIGFAFEAIKHGKQTLMVAGGSEELSPTHAAVFDTLYATSQRNDEPLLTPRPFDIDRDGLVVGEGATTMILEEREHALARGAKIYAEIVGYGSNSDGVHITQPRAETMAVAMDLALKDATVPPEEIGWVNAHGTSTPQGDIAESLATAEIFKRMVPITSLKSYFGHTLGACGAMEAWFGVKMTQIGWIAPTINLDKIDPDCADLEYVTNDGMELESEYFMNNNFAFGGINTSLIIRRID